MSHAFTSYFGFCDFNAAAFAYPAFEVNFFILSAVTFPVLLRTEDCLTEQTVFFRLECTVVDGFRLLDLAV